jgi:hypothetical protein
MAQEITFTLFRTYLRTIENSVGSNTFRSSYAHTEHGEEVNAEKDAEERAEKDAEERVEKDAEKVSRGRRREAEEERQRNFTLKLLRRILCRRSSANA